jgi:transcription elongation factor
MNSTVMAQRLTLKEYQVYSYINLEHLKKLIGQTIHISRGNWKGRLGVLRNVTDKLASVELSSKNKIINIDPSFIDEVDENNPSGYPKFDSNIGTPRNNFGSRTPAYYPQSPSYNSISSPKWNPHATRNYLYNNLAAYVHSPNPRGDTWGNN